MKRSLNVLLYIAAGFLLLNATALMLLWLWSPGEIAEGEIARVEIGGIEQGMILTGIDDEKPVLLFLHGGPSTPEYALAKHAGLRLEDYFTVCWWEQRGSGMSWSASIRPDSITIERLLEDTIEVTNYLRKRFDAEKIYLMGHSWGTVLGLLAAEKQPELYEAYIGIAQVSNQLESEKLAYTHMLETALAQGDRKTAQQLSKHRLTDADSFTNQYLLLRSNTLNKQGNGMFHEPMSSLTLVMQVLQARELTLPDKFGYVMGLLQVVKLPIFRGQLALDFPATVKQLDVPVYMIHGAFDRQVSYQLSKAYFDALEAPEKYFFTFENSAHSAFVEEPELFMRIIKEDLLGSEQNP